MPDDRPDTLSGPDASPPDAEARESLVAEIRSRAVKLLTTREHSRAELARKLISRGYPAGAVEDVVDGLARRELLSESRLVETYVAERLRKGFGPLRIRSELLGKGLSDAQIDPHLDLDDAFCLELIGAAHDRRFGAGADGEETDESRPTLAKRARFLEYRGFPTHLIARYLESAR